MIINFMKFNTDDLEFTSEWASTKAGTSLYMAPEVFRRKPYSNKADIWSLGVCGYEMISFELPFTNEADITDGSFSYKNLAGDNHPLVPLVHEMLTRDVTSRPTATQMLENVTQELQEQAGRIWLV